MKEQNKELRTKEVQLKVFRSTLVCDDKKCGGDMMATGKFVTEDTGDFYQHRCNKCDQMLFVKGIAYPKITYQDMVNRSKKK